MFNEWKAKRCKRKGHKIRIKCRKGYKDYHGSGAVAHKVIQKQKYCKRCGVILSDWEEEFINSIQSLTMSSSNMEKLHKDGYYWNNWWTEKE